MEHTCYYVAMKRCEGIEFRAIQYEYASDGVMVDMASRNAPMSPALGLLLGARASDGVMIDMASRCSEVTNDGVLSLYGLKQAPIVWYMELTSFLHTCGFRKSRVKASLFIYNHPNILCFFMVYVNDIVLTGNNIDFLNQFTHSLAKRFSIKDLGPLHHFLHIESFLFSTSTHLRHSSPLQYGWCKRGLGSCIGQDESVGVKVADFERRRKEIGDFGASIEREEAIFVLANVVVRIFKILGLKVKTSIFWAITRGSSTWVFRWVHLVRIKEKDLLEALRRSRLSSISKCCGNGMLCLNFLIVSTPKDGSPSVDPVGDY
ncbi:hypothetical protein OSB04_005825 [Centaurea solstitialis]|uniref:Reverse transcriptase Ty1/copia-type domain-containing protein n=1 Tax=Centaurea solstitialis TaxID=347529 RepID=A0AA38TTF7_9ASTR|nr:hypothetical protein OSB04_005825 [Centaurea solstitialis]